MIVFYRILIFTITICIPFSCVYGSNMGEHKVDSLKKALSTSKEDTNRVAILLELSNNVADTAGKLRYAKAALELAQKLNWERGQMDANWLLGIVYRMYILDYYRSNYYNEQALLIAQRLKDIDKETDLLTALGENYRRLNKYAGAIAYFKKAIDIQKSDENKISPLGNMGYAYADLGDYSNALSCYQNALKIWIADNSENKDSAAYSLLLQTIGDVYVSMSQYDKALANYDSATRINEGLKNPFLTVLLCISKGALYAKRKDDKQAIAYYEQGLNVAIAGNQRVNESDLLNRLSNIYFEMGELDKAMDHAKQSLIIAQQINSGKQLCETFITLGKINAGLHRNKEAVDYLKNAQDIAVRSGLLLQESDSWDVLRKVYKQMNEPAKALDAYEHYISTRDSLFSQEKAKAMIRKDMEYAKEQDSLKQEQVNLEAKRKFDLKLQKQVILTYSGFGGLVLLVLLSFVIFRNYNREKKANAIVQQEKEKSDRLLLNILPLEVADELKANGSVQAKSFEQVSVMFTDFVNFTTAGEMLGAQKLVDELDACFVAFDEILSNYNIEKIKTVGDAYLAVSGLPIANPKHAEDLVSAAIEIRDFMLQRRALLGDKTFEMRIGIHTGPVVAGIVGVRKFAYDIWGDTVNIAARMEQGSEAGKINISDDTYKLIQHQFSFTYRGAIDAKNKGKLKMYFVDKATVSV